MTIHKSKGLEFPVVIFPFADLDIYREKDPKEWYPLDDSLYQGFTSALLNYKKDDFKNFGDVGKLIFNKHQSKLELDNINLLYVALTRPIEQLYIISSKDKSQKSTKYSKLLIQYLQQLQQYNDTQSTYSFGNQKRSNASLKTSSQAIISEEFISTNKESHGINIITKSGFLWDTNQKEAIEKGNLIHDIMSKIYTINDVSPVITDYITSGTINSIQAKELELIITQILSHPSLKALYTSNQTSYNEQDIIAPSGKILRPDRLVIHKNNNATIIDYKTGVFDPKHKNQLQIYQDVLEEMSIKVSGKILVYISDSVNVVSV